MSTPLSAYVKKHYPMTKSDLFSVMMEQCINITNEYYYIAMITQHSWMFLKTYSQIRDWIINNKEILQMLHTGTKTFPEINGEIVQSTSFVIRTKNIENFIGNYIRLVEYPLKEKEKQIFNLKNYYTVNQTEFLLVPSHPIAYWMSENMVNSFNSPLKINDVAIPRKGMVTMDNNRFLRFWFEINKTKGKFDSKNARNAEESGKKWFPYSKGGSFRKWYGNQEYVVNWYEDGKEIKESIVEKYNGGSYTKEVRSEKLYFKPMLSWSSVSSGNIGFRFNEKGFLFDTSGPAVFPLSNEIELLSILNSKVINEILKFISPTLSYLTGDIGILPIKDKVFDNEVVLKLTKNNIKMSRNDWDSFETSWDFERHPFISNKTNVGLIQNAFQTWQQTTEENFNQLKANEEELNRIFIDIYGLQDELTPEVEDKDVTIRKAELERDVKSFLSYLVGVIFGRYSLDESGLIYAGGDFDPERYKSYQPDDNNIIPLTHENYFSDDIVTRITDLVTLIYGEETLEDNLLFIAQALKMRGSETSRDTIRRYFIKDFFKDHKKIYQKRPIYWQMSSGKQEAFKGIFYLHRYDHATLARVRTEYVLPLTNTLTELSNQMQTIIDGSALTREVAAARKEFENYQKQLQELRDYDLILKNLADQHIELDLDDGVKVNYEKFQNISVTNTRTGKPGKMNLLEKL